MWARCCEDGLFNFFSLLRCLGKIAIVIMVGPFFLLYVACTFVVDEGTLHDYWESFYSCCCCCFCALCGGPSDAYENEKAHRQPHSIERDCFYEDRQTQSDRQLHMVMEEDVALEPTLGDLESVVGQLQNTASSINMEIEQQNRICDEVMADMNSSRVELQRASAFRSIQRLSIAGTFKKAFAKKSGGIDEVSDA
jgi:hypothetical protein